MHSGRVVEHTANASLPEPQSPEQVALVAFRDLAAVLAEGRDLDTVFHLVVNILAELSGATRSSLHLLDRETGLFHGQAAHAATDIDAHVKRLVSGLPGDDFTREILESRSPVIVEDTAVDPRATRTAMRRWGARSVFGVPMVLRGEVIGIVCLDREDEAMGVSDFDRHLATSFGELAATAINQAQLTTQLRESLRSQARQLELLQRAHQMEAKLTDALLRGRGVGEAADVVSDLLNRPCAIYDVALRRLTRGGMSEVLPSSLDEVQHSSDADALQDVENGDVACIDLPGGRRLLVAPIDIERGRQGFVVVAGRSGALFSSLDEAVLRRAAHTIALERARSDLDDETEWQAIEALTGRLIRGEQADLEDRARSLGVQLDVPRVVCLLAARTPDGSMAEMSPQVVARLMTDRESPSAVLAAWSGEAIALIVEVPAALADREATVWAKKRLLRAVDRFGPATVYGAMSGVVAGAAEDVRAHREAWQVLRCMREHNSELSEVVLAASDLGAVRLLLATASRAEADRVARDTLGPLLDGTSKSEELLATLDEYVRCGRAIRPCAEALGVHPNTIRYRLANIERRTRLAVTTDDDDYLTVQLAVQVLRLHGELPVAAGDRDREP